MPPAGSRSFAEKVAVVTDGTNVFGRAAALQLALGGCYVIVGFSGASAENARALKELQSLGTLAAAVDADAATISGVNKLFEQVGSSYGRLDLLVNSAIFAPQTEFADADENDFAETINRNLKSAVFCSQAAAKLMANRPAPAIVNLIGENTANVLFAAASAALIGLTQSLAAEFAPKIRVNAVSFEFAAAEITKNSNDLLRPPTVIAPNDAAQTAIFLLSSEAAAITGQTLTVGRKRSKI